MSKKGRELELLIEKLEHILSGSDVEIIHDGRLPDRRTGHLRQIDVLVRAKIGVQELIIIIECRNRKCKDDVTWIEQLAGKRDAVLAHKAIAVSSSGFTNGAIEAARYENIDLRTIAEISISDVAEWFATEEIIVVQPHYELFKTTISTCGTGRKPSPTEAHIIKARLLEIQNNPREKSLKYLGEFLSISEIWNRSVSLPSEMWQMLEDQPGKKELIEYKITFDPPIEIVELSMAKICHITFIFYVSVTLSSYAPYQVAKYEGKESSLGDIVRFRVQVDGESQEIDIFRSENEIAIHSSSSINWKIVPS